MILFSDDAEMRRDGGLVLAACLILLGTNPHIVEVFLLSYHLIILLTYYLIILLSYSSWHQPSHCQGAVPNHIHVFSFLIFSYFLVPTYTNPRGLIIIILSLNWALIIKLNIKTIYLIFMEIYHSFDFRESLSATE